MGLSAADRFKTELHKISTYSKLLFPVYLEVTDTCVTPALSKLNVSFDKLINAVSAFDITNVNLSVTSPEESMKNARFINISREETLKVKTRISIDLIVEADLSNLDGFWNKTKALGEIIDRLDSFCESIGREKGLSGYLDRSHIAEYKKEKI